MNTIPNQKTTVQSVSYLSNYMETYDKQFLYEEYETKTYVDDVLYGLGVSLSDDFRYGNGFDKFKDFLREYLKK